MPNFRERFREWRSMSSPRNDTGLTEESIEQIARGQHEISRAYGESDDVFRQRLEMAIREIARRMVQRSILPHYPFAEDTRNRQLQELALAQYRQEMHSAPLLSTLGQVGLPVEPTRDVTMKPYSREVIGSHERPFTRTEMAMKVRVLCEDEDLPSKIYVKLMEAFTKPGDVGYRLHTDPSKSTCEVYINEVCIIKLQGNDRRDEYDLGRMFLNIVNDKMFTTSLIRTD